MNCFYFFFSKIFIDANGNFESLDDFLLTILKNTNAAALESVLSSAVLYAVYCITATSSDHHQKSLLICCWDQDFQPLVPQQLNIIMSFYWNWWKSAKIAHLQFLLLFKYFLTKVHLQRNQRLLSILWIRFLMSPSHSVWHYYHLELYYHIHLKY